MLIVDASVWVAAADPSDPRMEESRDFFRRAAACVIPGLETSALESLPLPKLQALHHWIARHRPELAFIYRLEVAVDGVVRKSAVVEGAGARGDRPLYVFDSIPLSPGRHDIRVTFTRVGARSPGPGTDAADAADAADEVVGGAANAREGARTIPDRLLLRRTVTVGGRDVVLVTYDPDRGVLELR